MLPDYDITIIGAGPAGLAAAARASKSNCRLLLLDGGKQVEARDRNNPYDATRGAGGAGLFSDGKFSFFPSASGLWTLPRFKDLYEAYAWTCETLGARGLSTPPFPRHPGEYSFGGADGPSGTENWFLKAYPSDYLSLDLRLTLVHDMTSEVRGDLLFNQDLQQVEYNAVDDSFLLHTRDREAGSNEVKIRKSKRIILATGRFGPLAPWLKRLACNWSFQRLEVGFRVEQASERAFFRNMRQLDPKLKFCSSSGSTEWRTFCVCRQGETVITETEGLWTVSGRSDCPPTGFSNSGFNTRVSDSKLVQKAVQNVVKSMSRQEVHFKVPMRSLVDKEEQTNNKFESIYGKELTETMRKGLTKLCDEFDDLNNDDEASLIGPTLEGVGWYPSVDGNLKASEVPLYIVGDACGLFRGIVAAMISGYYGGAAAVASLEQC